MTVLEPYFIFTGIFPKESSLFVEIHTILAIGFYIITLNKSHNSYFSYFISYIIHASKIRCFTEKRIHLRLGWATARWNHRNAVHAVLRHHFTYANQLD